MSVKDQRTPRRRWSLLSRRGGDSAVTTATVTAITALAAALIGGLAAGGAAYVTAGSAESVAEQSFLREQRKSAYAEFYAAASAILESPTNLSELSRFDKANTSTVATLKRLADANAMVQMTGHQDTYASAEVINTMVQALSEEREPVDQATLEVIREELDFFVYSARLDITPAESDKLS